MAQSTKQKVASKGKGKSAPTSAKGKPSNSIGNSGEMVGGPLKSKSQTPTPSNGKKPTLKIDILLAKTMPGIDSKGKPVKESGKKKGKK